MELHILIVTADGEYTVTTTLYNIVQLEREYRTTASAFAAGLSMEQLGFLAHEASKAEGHKPPAKLDDFLKSVKNLTVLDGDETGNPTPAVP